MKQLFILSILFVMTDSGCFADKNVTTENFKIKTSLYQSWQKSETEKGTNVFIEICNVKGAVAFDSLIFRNIRTKVYIEKKGDLTIINAIYELGIPKFENGSVYDSRSERLLFRIDNKKQFIEIKNWKRKKMRY